MDVNGTRFHLLLGRRDWQPVIAQTAIDPAHVEWAGPSALDWDEDFAGVRLLRQVPLPGPLGGAASAPRLRGMAADGFGNLLWIDEAGGQIRVQPAGLSRSGVYWSGAAPADAAPASGPFVPLADQAAPSPLPLRGLAATTHHYLVAGIEAPGGLLIFDLDAGAPPCRWHWPAALGFRPALLAARADGGLLVLDADAGAGRVRLWQLDRQFAPVGLGPATPLAAARAADFSPLAGPARVRPGRSFAGDAALGAGTAVDVVDPVGLASLPDDSAWLLDAGAPGTAARLLRLRAGVPSNLFTLDAAFTAPALGLDLVDACSLAVLVDAHDADQTSGRVFVATAHLSQAFEFAFSARGPDCTLVLQAKAYPLANDQRPQLVATADSVQFLAREAWFPLAEQPRYRYLPHATLCAGVPAADSAMRFDGQEPGCVWHRLMLDACVPPGTALALRCRADDDLARLERASWVVQPAPYLRADGSELPFERPFGDAGSEHLGTFETLLAGARGRYLQLELSLAGDGRASPRLRALRLYYPRYSYLQRYLPAVYREDREAADFLERWLANPEGLLTALEDRIAHAETVLDPVSAPSAYLDWLAGWFDATLDPSWDERRRRLFVKYAWLLYRWRGTALGLLSFLRLATDDCPQESLFDALRRGGADAPARFGGFSLRIVENHELQLASPLLLALDNTAAPGFADDQGGWQPRDGGARLHQLFQRWLVRRYGGAQAEPALALAALLAAWVPSPAPATIADIRYSALPPGNPAERADWALFGAALLGPDAVLVQAGDAAAWREFLARRHGSVAALNTAWGLAGSAALGSFGDVALPAEHTLPADGTPLRDWLQFVLLALPLGRDAHRFTVLVPARLAEPPELRAQRLARVALIVENEKPAHTRFEARLFWALFQVGSARLGLDSIVGESSRFLPLVLDAGALREGTLAAAHPWTATDRRVVGRDPLERNPR